GTWRARWPNVPAAAAAVDRTWRRPASRTRRNCPPPSTPWGRSSRPPRDGAALNHPPPATPAAVVDAARPRLVALDLDGTLLTSAKCVTERARRAIARLTAAGVRVVIATGRPPRSAMPFARALDAGTPTVVFHGAAVVSDTGATAHVRVLNTPDPEVALAAVARLRARVPGADLALESAAGWFVERWEPAAAGSSLRLDAA